MTEIKPATDEQVEGFRLTIAQHNWAARNYIAITPTLATALIARLEAAETERERLKAALLHLAYAPIHNGEREFRAIARTALEGKTDD